MNFLFKLLLTSFNLNRFIYNYQDFINNKKCKKNYNKFFNFIWYFKKKYKINEIYFTIFSKIENKNLKFE